MAASLAYFPCSPYFPCFEFLPQVTEAFINAFVATECTDAEQAWAFAVAAAVIGDHQPFTVGQGLLKWAWAFKERPWPEASVSQIATTLGFAFFTGFITEAATAIKNWAVPTLCVCVKFVLLCGLIIDEIIRLSLIAFADRKSLDDIRRGCVNYY